MPCEEAIDFPELKKGSVQITAVGKPSFSMIMLSSTLPELHDPQSPIPVITESYFSAIVFARSSDIA